MFDAVRPSGVAERVNAVPEIRVAVSTGKTEQVVAERQDLLKIALEIAGLHEPEVEEDRVAPCSFARRPPAL